MQNILEIKNFTKKYKDFSIENLSFTLEKGYIMGFIGPNGSGKTTTIGAIMNLIPKSSGVINIFDLPIEQHEKAIRDRIGFVYDECPYFLNLSLKNNAKLIAPFYSKWDQQEFERLMKLFELEPSKQLSKLSKGMKTKFSIVMALCHHAELIIMDEPTAGLDPIFRREILDIFYDLIQDGKTSLLFSTHITSDLERIADFITFIDDGKLVFSKPIDEIRDTYKIVKGSNDLLNKIPSDYIIGKRQTKYGFEALTAHSKEVHDLVGDSVLLEKATLEDIMIYHHTRKE